MNEMSELLEKQDKERMNEMSELLKKQEKERMNEMSELLKKQEKERQELGRKLAVVQHLPGTSDDWSIYQRGLYGTVGSITRRTSDYATRYSGARPGSIEDLAQTLGRMPPLPMYKVGRHGTVTYVHDPDDPAIAKKYDIMDRLEPPVLMMAKPGASDEFAFKWYTTIEGEVWEVEYPFSLYRMPVVSHWRRREYMGGYRYDRDQGHYGVELDRRRLELGATPTYQQYGQSSPEYMGQTNIYFIEGDGMDLELLLDSFMKATTNR